MMKLASIAVLAGATALSFALSLASCSPAGDTVGGQGGSVGNGGAAGGSGGSANGGSSGSGSSVVVKLDASLLGTGGAGGSSTTSVSPTADANCGAQTSTMERQPADVLLVFDRSGSMSYDITGDCICDSSWSWWGGGCADPTTCTARWDGLSSAVSQTLSTASDIRWGLKLFPSSSGDACFVDSGVDVPIGASSTSLIQSVIANTTPDGNTPTAEAIRLAASYLQSVSDQNSKVILLATDGEPNCKNGGADSEDSDEAGTISAITAAKNAGFPVYVIGIGPSVGNLDSFAQAGGTSKYYPATSTQSLASALASISKAVVTCTFELASAPPDINNIAVYLDKGIVPKSDSNGWSLGPGDQSVILNGSYCDKLNSGEASTVQLLFGCPGYVPPDVIP